MPSDCNDVPCFQQIFESHTGGKIRITLKNNKNFDVFC